MEIWFEPVIGLEIHVQLRTRSKMFCGSDAAYGAPPNTLACPVCLGLPGALPVVNRQAVELGVRAALGVHATVHPRSVFARKHYFYPDLPKGYQISQAGHPLATGGYLDVPGEQGETVRVRIRRLHLEEDSGKSIHDRVAGATALDFNRAGVPLAEIVTEPDLSSPAQARAFLVRLKQAVEYLGVSDCNMEEGSLRADANVSVRAAGEPGFGTKTEIKNLNSLAGVERALEFEIRRQERVRRAGGTLQAETRLWDAARREARPLRSKEEIHDYRYFPEPDLPPLELQPEWIEQIRRSLPEMPWQRSARVVAEYGVSPAHAEVLTSTRELADFYEGVVSSGADPHEAASWTMGEVLAAVNAAGCRVGSPAVRPHQLAELIRLVSLGTVSRPAAREVFARMLQTGGEAADIVVGERLEQVRDGAAIEGWVAEVLRQHPAEWERLRAGESKLISFFVGQVMRRSAGKADPKRADAILRDKLDI